ncbi:unnamed protein product, partial [Lymnaea stagnalis]
LTNSSAFGALTKSSAFGALTNRSAMGMSTNTLVTQNEFIALIGMFTTIDMILSATGVVSNLINIRTFVAMGADDGVTVSFLFLSLSEFTCCLAALGQKLAMALWVTEMATEYKTWFHVNPYAFNSFFGNIRTCLFAIPVFITTYLAVAKCMCVVKPLGFKNMFSVTRTVKIMYGICAFSLLAYVPVLATMGIAEQFDKNVNTTRKVMWFSPYRDLVKNIVWNVRDSFPAIASEIIIVACVVVMTRSLSEAVGWREKFRSETLSDERDTHQNVINKTLKMSHIPRGNLGGKLKGKPSGKLSGKELQVIKQVTVICVVYVIGNTPKIIIFLAFALVPDLTPGGRYQNLYEVIFKSRELSELLLSVVHIFIYYKYNSKFRLFCKC